MENDLSTLPPIVLSDIIDLSNDTQKHKLVKEEIKEDVPEILDNNIYINFGDKYFHLTYDNILIMIKKYTTDFNFSNINVPKMALSVYEHLKKINTFDDIVNQIISYASNHVSHHDEYNKLGIRILMDKLHKVTHKDYGKVVDDLYKNKDSNGHHSPIICKQVHDFAKEHITKINSALNYERDFNYTIFGFRTLEKAYLKKLSNNKIVERPQHMLMRVAIGIYYYTNDIERVIESYHLMSQGYFTHATPTLYNAGSNYPQLSSCFLCGGGDSLLKIGELWHELATISKFSGGIGVHLHKIRAKGTYINSTQGPASGLEMIQVLDSISKYANQGGKRPGSFAVYIEPWHADIKYFLRLKLNNGPENERSRNIFTALWIPDLFMKRVENDEIWSLMCPYKCPGLDDVYGDEFEALYTKYESEKKFNEQIKARELWYMMMTSQIEAGIPYVGFKDNVNKKSNQKNVGTIRSSNLCVTGSTVILTDWGYKKIRNLKDQKVNVWNGEEFSKVTVRQTGVDQKIIKIVLSNGEYIKCTPYHKFYIAGGARATRKDIVEAKDLKTGMRIIKFKFPVIDTEDDSFKYPYTHGLFSAEGCYEQEGFETKQCNYEPLHGKLFCKRHIDFENYDKSVYESLIIDEDKCHGLSGLHRPRIALYGVKKDLVKHLDTREDLDVMPGDNKKTTVRLPLDLADKYVVPINYSLNVKLRWLEGLCDGDGTIARSGKNPIQLQICSIHKPFLKNVKRMINTMGADGKIRIMEGKTTRILPDGKGGSKEYECQALYRLLISSYSLYKLKKIGFSPKRLDISDASKQKTNRSQFIYVEKIIDNNQTADTYCFNEKLRHSGIFNGILTSQCIEILEYSDNDEYSVCSLSSICLPKFVNRETKNFDFEKLHDVAQVVTRNLDNVINVNYYPVEKTRISNMRHRPLGIGVQGLADTFAMLGLPFDSKEARELNKLIFETIYHGTITMSMELAKKYGPYSTFKDSPFSKGEFQFDMWGVQPSKMWDWPTLKADVMKHGTRNSLLTALMPTASTSQILGSNEAFEIITSNYYSRETQSGIFQLFNKHLMRDLIELGLWNDDMRNRIRHSRGSIQDIDEIPSRIKEIYRTVWEIPQKHVIEMAAERGAFIDQTQSMNLFFAEPSFTKLTSALFYGWKLGLKTGMYYLRSKPAFEGLQFGVSHDIKDSSKDTKETKDARDAKLTLTEGEPVKEKEMVCKFIPKHLRGKMEFVECEMCSS